MTRKQKPKPRRAAHFTWPDAVVLAGAALVLPVAIYEGNWFFAVLGVAFAAVIGARVVLTRWLVNRSQTKP